MRARSAEFVISAAEPRGFPRQDLPEFAFAGRSNVGKSSLLNTLVGVDGLARTSNTPGRTRLINWFRIEPAQGPTIAFVDLPGYGYAKVPRDMREGWRPLVEAYLTGRHVLCAVLVLIDARRGAEDDERSLLEYLDESSILSQVVLTKIDKVPKAKRKLVAAEVRRDLRLARDPLMCSATTTDGLVDLWRFLVHTVSNARSEAP